ncbi:MAG: FAD-dependent oxidoreductase [Dehalococcoidales bacterium]|nr:FAD-dependent oxidoreductase [Dehalococcoidales bacterium]
MTKKYDVVIIGGGPAGIFTALELVEQTNMSIMLIEKGKDIDRRKCPIRDNGGACKSCLVCNMVCGLGGAGAFSDGKLTLSGEVGGWLPDYLGNAETKSLIKYVDNIYLKFGASNKLYGVGEEVEELERRSSLVELRLIPVPIRHLGTERCQSVLKTMRDHLKSRINIKLKTAAAKVMVNEGKVSGIETEDGDYYECQYLVLAPGREGSEWLSNQAKRLNLTMHNNPVDVGIRVEVPSAVLESITNVLYEVKLEYLSRNFNDRIRTFCMCPGGEVIMESTGGAEPVVSVNGHSYAEKHTGYTNFALLVSTSFTKPFHEPIAYGKYIARLANILSGGILVQRWGDLIEGRRSTPHSIARGMLQPTLKSAIPGDLSFVLPYRHLTGIIDMIQTMDKLVPGVASRHSLLYGVEVKFYSSRLQLNNRLETEIRNLFAIGDGAGVSRGLIQASASGIVAARAILRSHG